MRRLLAATLLLSTCSLLCGAEVEFNRDIRPILSDRCFFCHGPDEKKRKADLRLDTREGALADLGDYAAIVPGEPEKSELLHRVTAHDVDELMPPPKAKRAKLSADEVALIRRWIEQGAEYQGHWAFEPIARPDVPDPGVNPIDAFIQARLKREAIAPSPKADRHVLIRRAYLDLVGLLPTPEETEAFVSDESPLAYENLVDRLLASPHFGERWGRHWLDGARYADSHGYSVDGERQMWPFRDWVIKALNDDMPFDQFTIEQIGGDLLPKATKSQIAASAFHRNTLINQEGGTDAEQFRVEATMDRVNTTGAVWLGLTVGCAQCHTHKFDPIKHEEYYRMFAFFNSAADRNNTGPTIEVLEGELFPSVAVDEDITSGEPDWTPFKIEDAKTSSGAEFVKQDDGSLLITADAEANESYQILGTTELEKIASLRLRVLTDKSLPQNGPGRAGNGNFVLTRIDVRVAGHKQAITSARADHEQPGYPATAAIDEKRDTGWAINVGPNSAHKMNAPHELVLNFPKSVVTKGKAVEVHLHHDINENYLIGRLAIDVSPTAIKAESPATKSSAKLMVMGEVGKPRETYVLTRGDFTRPDKERGQLSPGVPSAIAPALPDADSARTRLDLARWLVSPENPLTPRVTVNRIWMRHFGIGLVETEEDFGTQGALPSHPELLDYLAHRLIADGWSMKKLHRLIVTSDAYQRSSDARPDLATKDPRNLLLARQSRIRLDAEIIRDAALCASGMLDRRIGGPSVYPPQPEGIYSFTQSKKRWSTSTGGDRFRRGMYTFFYRSAPYPLFGTFDAPDFQTTCTRRPRSNTPLQALNIANDPAFIELAKALAARVVEELPGDPEERLDARLRRAFFLAINRPPEDRELAVLRDYTRSASAEFAKDRKSALALVDKRLVLTKTPPGPAAALIAAARTILNTDNFITRE